MNPLGIGTCQVCGEENCEIEHADQDRVALSTMKDPQRWIEAYTMRTSENLHKNATLVRT